MNPKNGEPSVAPARVGDPSYAQLSAQPSGFQFIGTLVTRFFATVELGEEAR